MLNKVTLIGNLGNEPESRFTPSGDQITTLTLATSRKWKDKQGQPQSETEWHRITIFGKLAKVASDYLHKGSKVYFEGRIKTTKYQKDGADVYSTGIIAESMVMLDGRPEGQGNNFGQSPGSQFDHQPQYAAPAQNNGGPQTDNFADFDDDIPF